MLPASRNKNYFFSWDFGEAHQGNWENCPTYLSPRRILRAIRDGDRCSSSNHTRQDEGVCQQHQTRSEIYRRSTPRTRAAHREFDASESKDPNGNVIKYEWDFWRFRRDGSESQFSRRCGHHTRIHSKRLLAQSRLSSQDNNYETQVATQTIGVGEAPNIPLAKITTTPPLDEQPPRRA